MGVTLKYNPAYSLSMGAARSTGEGDLLRQLNEIADRKAMEQARLDEGARQFDLGLAASQYDRQSQRGYQYAALGADIAQNQAQLQQQAYNQQAAIDARLTEQQMYGDQMMAGQQAQTERAFIGEQARMAREAANRRFEKSMKDREVLLDQFNKGLLTPQQEQQAIARWEELAGMEFGLPDEMANQDASAAEEARVNDIATSFFTDPMSGGPLATPQQVRSMLEMGIEPKDITAHGLKMQAESRQRAALQQQQLLDQTKYEDAKANIERDDVRADQQLTNTQAAHEQKMEFDKQQAEQRLLMNAVNNYQAARLKWATAKNAAFDEEGKAALGPEPKLEDFLLPEMQGGTQSTEGQKIITNRYGKRAIVHPDGSRTPID